MDARVWISPWNLARGIRARKGSKEKDKRAGSVHLSARRIESLANRNLITDENYARRDVKVGACATLYPTPFIDINLYFIPSSLSPSKNLGYYFILFARFPSFPVSIVQRILGFNPRDWSFQMCFSFLFESRSGGICINGREGLYLLLMKFLRGWNSRSLWTLQGRFNFNSIDDRKLRFGYELGQSKIKT